MRQTARKYINNNHIIKNHTIIRNVRQGVPLIHCITNYVSVGDVANMLLAAGGTPIMADGIHEVEEITSICRGLVINIGTLDDRSVEAMIKAGKKAAQLGHPIVFDPVGAGASSFRTNTAIRLLKEIPFTVIRGNVSEIRTIADGSGNTQGVDAADRDRVTEENLPVMCEFMKRLSARTGAVIVMTGAIDLVSSPSAVSIIRNGHPLMAKITGCGCMLDAVIAAYLCENKECMFDAAVLAVAAFGLCGELAAGRVAAEDGGTGSFRIHLLDYMSKIDDGQLKGGARIEIR